jgi:hypothetical protein
LQSEKMEQLDSGFCDVIVSFFFSFRTCSNNNARLANSRPTYDSPLRNNDTSTDAGDASDNPPPDIRNRVNPIQESNTNTRTQKEFTSTKCLRACADNKLKKKPDNSNSTKCLDMKIEPERERENGDHPIRGRPGHLQQNITAPLNTQYSHHA